MHKNTLQLLIIGLLLRNIKCKSSRKNITNMSNFEVSQLHVTAKSASNIVKSSTTFENPCPKGFTYSSNKQYCYVMTEPQNFPPKCPYPTFTFPEPSFISSEGLASIDIWAMITRDTSDDGFGPFEVTKGVSYGMLLYHYFEQSNIWENNCMVISNGTYVPSNCEKHYPALCIYHYGYPATHNYCQKHYGKVNGYTNCIPNSIGMESKRCYCAREEQRKMRRDQFCTILAEPLNEYQNYLLVNQLQTINHDVCWFGLYTINKVARWTISDTPLNYSNWIETDYAKPFGAIKFGEPAGWILNNDDETVQCGVCELQTPYDKNVSLQLKYIAPDNELELRIKNPFELSNTYGDEYALFCFVGPTVDDFRQRALDVVVFEGDVHKNPGDFFRRIDNDHRIPIYYWCEGFQNSNLTPVYSNKILVYNRRDVQEYSIEAKVQSFNDPYLDKHYLVIRDKIKKKLTIMFPYELRVMKIIRYNQKNFSLDIILHLTSDWRYQNEESVYNILLTDFQKLAPVVNITRFGQCDFCLADNKSFHWPKTVIGAVTVPTEICLQINGEPISRKCEGDFLRGAVWSDVIGICTNNTDFPAKTLQLHQLLQTQNVTANDLSRNLSKITDDSNVSVLEIDLISEILIKINGLNDAININDVAEIISNIMEFDPNRLKRAQKTLNCTDKILNTLGSILAKTKSEYSLIVTPKLVLQINDIRKTNITGLGVREEPKATSFQRFALHPLHNNITLEQMLQADYQLVAFLPHDLILEIERCIPPTTPIKLIMALFYNDVLFNDNDNQTRHVNSRIINILIPNFNCSFSTPISIFFRPLYNPNSNQHCGYWRYGFDEVLGTSAFGS